MNKKIIDYRILGNTDGSSWLVKEVMEMIDEGWQPLGGVSRDSGDTLFQAMVKYEDNENSI